MKRLIGILVLLVIATVSFAQSDVRLFRTTEFSYKYETEYGWWTDWSDWKKCKVNIKMDLENDKIIIYTKEPQIYYVYDFLGEVEDDYGQTIKFAVIDNEDDYGYIRLRVQDNGTKQLYVDFENIKWVYNLL